MKETFSSRIFFYILPWMAVLFLLASLLFFHYQSSVFLREKREDMELVIADRAGDFDERFQEIKTELAYVGRFPSVRKALLHYGEMDFVERYLVRSQISEDLSGINIFNDYIEDIIIVGLNGFFKNLDSYESLRSDADPLSWDSIRNYQPGNSFFSFTPPYEADYYAAQPHRVFSAVLPIRENGELIGYVQGNLNYQKVTGMLESSLKGRPEEGTVFGAITGDGRLIFIGDGEIAPTPGEEKAILEGAVADSGAVEIREPYRQILIYRRLSATGWIFFGKMSYRVILQPVLSEARVLVLGVLPTAIIVMSLAIHFLSLRIQKPMERLRNRVENVDIENYSPDGARYEIREVQIVADRFEESMERNCRLIRHVFQEELLRKDAELEVLRNQITPHFIYNSLQLIKAEAVMSGNREIGRSVNALAGLLRYSMDSHTDTVCLGEELEYIGHYLEIYRKRYVDRFTFEIDSSPDLEKVKIPKMILQPLAENSIRHGFEDVRKGGRICIHTEREGDYLMIRMEDNGSGISSEKLREIRTGLEDPSAPAAGSIGLLNVHRRIRLQCGDESGIVWIGNLPSGGTGQLLRIRTSSGEEGEIRV